MKYKVFANFSCLDPDIPDILELDDNLSEREVEEEIREYVFNFLDWCYEKEEKTEAATEAAKEEKEENKDEKKHAVRIRRNCRIPRILLWTRH